MTPPRPLLRACALLVPFLALLVALQTGWGPLLRLDRRTESRLDTVALGSQTWVDTLGVVTTVGGPGVLGVGLGVVAAVLAVRGRVAAGLLVVGTWAGSVGLNRVAKELVGRERPVFDLPGPGAAGLSFPSGHAQGIVVAAVLVLVLLRTRRPAAVAAAVAAVLLVCFSRLGLGVHYLSDVTAGASLGAAWVSLLVPSLVRAVGPGRSDPAAALPPQEDR